ncbi:MAG: hypothetical protein SF097_21570 [Acidobacteriota bacterium]|nr:hypothetical protein [Acidobacteriota bacterium]
MSDHKHDNNHGQVEGAGVKPKPILVFLAVLAVATALVYVIILGVEIGLQKFEDTVNPQQPATALETGRKLPPEPRLQGAPEPNPDKPGDTKSSLLPLEDMAVQKDKVEKQAAAYGWVDQPGGVAHIPIERAKQIIAEKGLPKLSDALAGEVQAAEAARKLVMNSGSNGGRGIKSQKQAPVSAQPQTAASATAQPVVNPAAAPAKTAAAGAKQ